MRHGKALFLANCRYSFSRVSLGCQQAKSGQSCCLEQFSCAELSLQAWPSSPLSSVLCHIDAIIVFFFLINFISFAMSFHDPHSVLSSSSSCPPSVSSSCPLCSLFLSLLRPSSSVLSCDLGPAQATRVPHSTNCIWSEFVHWVQGKSLNYFKTNIHLPGFECNTIQYGII